MTSIQREQDLSPVRIPIDKGLPGWRNFLIQRSMQARFTQIKTLAQLKQFQAGQGHDWPDTIILRSNGLPVVGEAKYEGLFQLLQNGAIDYFLRYPAALYLPERAALKKRLLRRLLGK